MQGRKLAALYAGSTFLIVTVLGAFLYAKNKLDSSERLGSYLFLDFAATFVMGFIGYQSGSDIPEERTQQEIDESGRTTPFIAMEMVSPPRLSRHSFAANMNDNENARPSTDTSMDQFSP